MDKEFLSSLFEVIKESEEKSSVQISKNFEVLLNTLNDIKNIAFNDLTDGKISVIPYGDFVTNTFYDNSLIECLIIYHTSRDNIDFTTPVKKFTKKGKVKLSTYQQIIGAPLNNGVIQAEEIASRFANYLKGMIGSNQKIYCKYNVIMLKINEQLNAKITVCYDADYDKGKLLVRRVNTWTYINPFIYLKKIDQKDHETNYNYSKFVKLFKALELELIIAQESKLLIGTNHYVENLLYNVPSNLFLDEDIAVMNNIMFYLKNINPNQLKLVDETYDYLFDENSYYERQYYKQYLNKISYAFNNIAQIIDKTSDRDDN